MRLFLSVLAFLLILMPANIYAQSALDVCGAVPSFDVNKESEITIKADLEGKATALSKYIGEAGLGGKIESVRKLVYETSENSEALRNESYLYHLFCVLVITDNTASNSEKRQALMEFRRPLNINGTESIASKLRINVDKVYEDIEGNVVYQGSPYLLQIAISNIGSETIAVQSTPGGNCKQNPIVSPGSSVIVTGIDVRVRLAKGVVAGKNSQIAFEVVGDLGKNDGACG